MQNAKTSSVNNRFIGNFESLDQFVREYLLSHPGSFESPLDDVALGDFIDNYVDCGGIAKDLIENNEVLTVEKPGGIEVYVCEHSSLLESAITLLDAS